MEGKCANCRKCLDLEISDYTQGGCRHTKVSDEFICLAYADEGLACVMRGLRRDEAGCEAFEAKKKKKEKQDMKNFVIIKHDNGGKFLFYVPKNVLLVAGDEVVCETARSKNEHGICCCDSFVGLLETVCPLFGTQPERMKYVTGRMHIESFPMDMAEEEQECIEMAIDDQ